MAPAPLARVATTDDFVVEDSTDDDSAADVGEGAVVTFAAPSDPAELQPVIVAINETAIAPRTIVDLNELCRRE